MGTSKRIESELFSPLLYFRLLGCEIFEGGNVCHLIRYHIKTITEVCYIISQFALIHNVLGVTYIFVLILNLLPGVFCCIF